MVQRTTAEPHQLDLFGWVPFELAAELVPKFAHDQVAKLLKTANPELRVLHWLVAQSGSTTKHMLGRALNPKDSQHLL